MVKRWRSIAASIIIGAVGMLWALYSLRIGAILLAIALVAVLSFGSLSTRPWLIAVLAALVLGFPFQPVDITFRSVPGGPKLLRCCPGVPYSDYRAALRMDQAGVCAFCTDLSTGFDASWYWVW